jgi:Cu(I)/Ag(I) efflux system membrane fusion protein
MQQREAGIYEATVNLGMCGQWDVTVTIERTGAPPIQVTFSVVAGQHMPPM